MAIKFEKVEAGMVLYDRHREKMGNTTISAIGEWRVAIKDVDRAKRKALVSWNGNPPQWWHAEKVEKLHTWSMRDDDVEVKRNILGGVISVKRKRTPKAGTSAA